MRMARWSTAMPSRRRAGCRSILRLLGVDLLSMSAHKFGGPLGAGALVVRDGVALAAHCTAAARNCSGAAGTENVAAIAGFGRRAPGRRLRSQGDLRDHVGIRALGALP